MYHTRNVTAKTNIKAAATAIKKSVMMTTTNVVAASFTVVTAVTKPMMVVAANVAAPPMVKVAVDNIHINAIVDNQHDANREAIGGTSYQT